MEIFIIIHVIIHLNVVLKFKQTQMINLVVFIAAPHPNAFPGHQPETDSQSQKNIYNSWETTTRAGYVDPRIREKPLDPVSPSQQS